MKAPRSPNYVSERSGDFSLNRTARERVRSFDQRPGVYTLYEVTEAAGVAFARAKKEPNAERAAQIYSDVLIEELKRGT